MSYSQAEVQEMLRKIADAQNLIKGQVQSRFESLDKDYDALKSQLTAIERAVALAAAPGGGEGIFRPRGPYATLGQQLVDVARAGMPGQQADRKLVEIMAATGAGESVPSEGGFLVAPDFQTELRTSVFETAKLAKLCRRIPISSNANGLILNGVDETSRVSGSRQGGIRGYWVGEAAEKTATKPKFRRLELSLKKLVGLCYSSDELLQDATALEAIIRAAFTSEFGFLIDDAILNGTGAGMPLGILNSAALVTVSKETGQAAATVVAENVIKMWSRLLPGSESTCVWLANKNVLPQLLTMSVAVGTGGIALYQPANQLAGQPFQTLFGRPVIFIEQCATLGTVGDITLADFQNGYVLCEKTGGIRADVSIHVRYVYDESVFRFVWRLDGQPYLGSSITPFKGGASDTQSHFVALQTRA